MTAAAPAASLAAIFLAAPFADAVETPGEWPDRTFPPVATPVRASSTARSAYLRGLLGG